MKSMAEPATHTPHIKCTVAAIDSSMNNTEVAKRAAFDAAMPSAELSG